MRSKSYKNLVRGIAAAPGIAIGKAHIYHRIDEEVNEYSIEDVSRAISELEEAFAKSKKELTKIFNMAVDKLGEKRAAIFEAQLMILDDPILRKNIIDRIKNEKKNPEFIVNDEISKYQELMVSSEIEYLQERSYDIEDIKNRIIRNLRKKKLKSRIEEDVIVVSQKITPADTLLFNRVNSLGYVTDFGGLTSHAAIVARSLGIPAVVGAHDATSKISDGDLLIVDGFHGEVIINPTKEQLEYYKKKIEKLSIYDNELKKLKDLPAVTKDGKKIVVTANIDLIEEIDLAISNGGEGVGLVRTEQIFDLFTAFPEEEEQFEVYSKFAERIYPHTIIIRAFDIGGDKVLPVDLKEPNPFLGWRGIRFLLDNIEMFKSQIKAVLRANKHGNIKFMIPMVTAINEIKETKEIISLAIKELEENGKSFNPNLQLGVMIEVPSAALMANKFAKYVDFMSIGTNDLIQYLLAVDRGNDIISDLYQEFHPSVVRSLRTIIEGGKSEGVTTTICGEMAADPIAVPLLVGLGLDSVSVNASSILHIKKIIRSLNFEDAKKLAEECMEMETECQIKSRLKEFYEENVKDKLQSIN